MRWRRSLRMSTKNRTYNPIREDGYDNKVSLHNDEEFQHGIQFKVKYIGSLEVPKPTSRGEIVADMRRIRYEFKARSVKKRPVNLSISVDGIQAFVSKKNKKNFYFDEDKNILAQHPINRVFYVSHDSQDLKIFSFIARDNTTNAFRCNVFKAYKTNEAIHIVRTIGQAFEVCHKLSLQKISNNTLTSSPAHINFSHQENTTLAPNMDSVEKAERYLQSVQIPISSVNNERNVLHSYSSSEFTLKHQMQFMQEQLQQMQHESELAFNQIKLIKEQLNIEIAARIDSQKKNKQLIDRNRELLTHIQQLLNYTRELEMKLNKNENLKTLKGLPSRPSDLLLLPSLFSTLTASISTSGTLNQQDLSSDSPDSGKGQEMSSENISDAFQSSIHDQQITNSWNNNNNINKNNNHNHNCTSILDDITSQSISINETISKNNNNNNPDYEEYSSTSSCSSIKMSNKNHIEHYIYDHIIPTGSASFTNSAFTGSPLNTINN
ncbi:unnamed protein product [Rotaria sordida]|uniref:PID domain-containing protein n=1 Tax=Rotaria sordida TaxID=392033 RepID=A0A815I7K2_9BILA|nr:unnamed protein product [Rotaria sordida]